jgi:ATP-dependent RNA helicase SUPV3L1/SUV3
LKPAARALASLLWAEKQDNVDMSALSGAQHLAGSGRTSFPVDKALPRDAYRVLGYRQCGERAVRVDILERLADLIRPALAWRESSPGAKPSGAFDGRGFVVTQAMTSLTGSAGEDFASILRALGYRMERRPAPPPKPAVVEPVAAEAAPAEGASETLSEAAAIEAAAATANLVAEETPDVAETPDAAETPVAADGAATAHEAAQPSEQAAATPLAEAALPTDTMEAAPAVVEAQPEPENSVEVAAADAPELPTAAETVEAPEAQPAAETETPSETAVVSDAAPVDTGAVAASDAAPAPEMVEVWRPGGRSEERRPRHDRNRHRHQDRPAEGAQPAAAVAGEAGDAAKHERHRRGRRDRHNEFRKLRADAAPAEGATVVAADGAPAAAPREDKPHPPRERFHGKGRDQDKGRDDKGRDKDKGKFGGGRDKGGRDKGGRDKRPDAGPSHRQYASSAAPRERERAADPNSPFAKLAALKEQLTANRKDR